MSERFPNDGKTAFKVKATAQFALRAFDKELAAELAAQEIGRRLLNEPIGKVFRINCEEEEKKND